MSLLLSRRGTIQTPSTGGGGGGGSWEDAVVATGPTAFLRLADTSGTTAVDSSGNNNDGNYVGSPDLGVTGLVPSDSDLAISIRSDAVGHAEANLGTGLAVAGASWMIAYKGTGGGNVGARLLLRDDVNSGGWWGPRLDTANVTILVGGQTHTTNYATSNLKDDVAHLIVITVGTTVKLYVDGSEVWSGTRSGTAASQPKWMTRNGRNAEYVYGTFDEWAFWHKELSAGEVTSMWDAWTV